MRYRTALAAVAGVLAAVIAPAVVAEPRLTVLQPVDGAVVSRSATPRLTISGTVAFDEPLQAQETRRFYFRTDNPTCGAEPGAHRHLSATPGTAPEPAACGLRGGWNLWGEVWPLLIDEGEDFIIWNFPTEDGTPLTYDASKPVAGTLVISSCGDAQGWSDCDLGDPPPAGLGGGLARLHVALVGEANGVRDDIGTITIEYLVTPDRPRYTINFSLPSNAASDKKDYDRLILRVRMNGPAVNHGWIRYRGQSFVDVPVWTPSSATGVQVAIDSEDALSTEGITVNPDGTWTATQSTPWEPGEHTVIVRAFQGDATSEPVVRRIQVTS